MPESFGGFRKASGKALAALLLLSAAGVWGSVACGGEAGSASCDALCANALGSCGADVDGCMKACAAWRNAVPSACSSQGDALNLCLQRSSDLDCGGSTLSAPSCSDSSTAFQTCAGGAPTGPGVTSDGGGGTPSPSPSGSVRPDGGAVPEGGGHPGSDGGASGVCSAASLPISFGGSTSACTSCASSQCCPEDNACGASADCLAEIDCVSACATGDTACSDACDAAHPTGAALNATLLECLYGRCPAPCMYPNPCTGTTGTGYTCGAGLTGGDPSRLYLCSDGTTAGSVACASSCHPSPVGVNDYCVSSDPCANNSFVSLVACGTNLSPNADAATLYTCNLQRTASVTHCANGCVAAPLGQSDHCR